MFLILNIFFFFYNEFGPTPWGIAVLVILCHKSPDNIDIVVYSRSGKSPDNISVIVLYLLIYCSFFGCLCICKQSGAKNKTPVSMLVFRRGVVNCAHWIENVFGQCWTRRLQVQQVWKMNIHE